MVMGMAAEPGFSNDRRLMLARQITAVENDTAAGRKALDETFKKAGNAILIGVTGAPGTGKSSLVNQLTSYLRSEKKLTVGIVAVDPSSPFTGGAILGDRVRMRDLVGDNGVFIRSMASRGALGGLALTTAGVVQLLDAAGYDVVMIETVGAGQSEVEIARLAHTTLVVEAPGFGDDIQAIKAGILEIADILVLNKADLPGVESTERALKANLEMGYPMGINGKAGHQLPIDKQDEIVGWQPPVVKTVATKGTGMKDLVKAIFKHQEYIKGSGTLAARNKERLKVEFEYLLRHRLLNDWQHNHTQREIEQALSKIYSRQLSPQQAVEQLI
jgi:LAO/AO transport system kinase